MSNLFQLLRNVLTQNKILFETLAASLLSLMAIVVSIAQMRTASQQTSLLTLQTRIAEAQALPQFEIGIHQKLNPETSKFDDDNLVVSNRGGAIHDFSADTAYFLRVEADVGDNGYRKFELPVHGYFASSYVTVSGVGDLITMTGYRNNAAYVTLVRKTSAAASVRKWSFANVDEQLVIRLRYLDLLDRGHEDYFQVPFVGAAIRIPKNIGEASMSRWSAMPHYELSDLTPEIILALASRTATR
jgi:hypothetical protein